MRSRCTASWMLVVVLLAILLTVSPVCGRNSSENVVEPKQNTPDLLQTNLASVNQVSDSVTNLAQKIAGSIASPDSKTEIFSPVSIAGALSLLLLGAGGQTEQELRSVMGFNESQLSLQQIHQTLGPLFQDLVTNDPSLEPLVSWRVNDKCNQYDEEDEYEDAELENTTVNTSSSHLISVANGMFLQNGLKPADRFLADVQRYYQSSVENLDFEHDPARAAVSINEWCARETHGKIKEMVTGQTVSNSRMIIASALYFKAQWETTFSPYATRPRPFYLSGRQEPPINVETMATTGCFPYYDATAQLDAKIIGLPYETGNSTMYIVLPNESTREKLQQLQATLGADQLNMMIDQMVTKNGMMMLPKMSISNTVQLNNVLQHLGVHDLFNPTRSNLTRVLDETVSQTDTQQETSIQQPNSAIPTDQPVPSNGDTPASTAVAEDPVTPTIRSMTKRETKSSAEQEDPQETNERQPVSPEQPTDDSQSQPTQPQSLEPSTIGQSMTFPFNVSVCNQVENCEYTEAHGCTCTILPTNDDAAECGKHVARYVDDSKGRMCIISTGNDEIGRKFICIKRSYCWSNLQSACERNACHFFRNQCYCCERNLTSPTFVQGSQITETTSTSTPRSDGVVSTSPTSIEGDEDQRLQPLQQGEIENPDEPVQAQQQLFVSEVITQVKLDVNEQGTEGGAVTLALIDRIGPGYTFQVDGPFLILIRHDITKALLFYGAVYDPRP